MYYKKALTTFIVLIAVAILVYPALADHRYKAAPQGPTRWVSQSHTHDPQEPVATVAPSPADKPDLVKATGDSISGTVDAAGDSISGTVDATADLKLLEGTGDFISGTVDAAGDTIWGTMDAAGDMLWGTVSATGETVNAVFAGPAD